MKLLTQSEVDSILKSFQRVFAHNDIEKLTKPAYDFIMLSSGFIAHYNIHGFRWEYQYLPKFASTILSNQPLNQWRNFRPGEKDYEYMMQKKEIYNKICTLAEWYLDYAEQLETVE